MGRKRDRDAEANDRESEPTAKQSVTKSPSAALPEFHLPTPRPTAPPSNAPQPQFHLPSPRPPPPGPAPASSTELSSQPTRPSQQPVTTTAQPITLPTTATPPTTTASTQPKKRKHRKRKSTAPPPQPVDPALQLPPVPAGHYHVFLGGLPYSATREAVRRWVEQAAGCYVWGVRLAEWAEGESRGKGEGRGFCHVELESEKQVARMLLRNGEVWSDGETRVTVQLARPKGDKRHASDAPASE